MIIISMLLLLIALIFLGMPVGFAMGISGLLGMYLVAGWDSVQSLLQTVPFRTAASYLMTVIPMFVLMAQGVSAGGIVIEVFTAARCWLGRLPGGLAIATVFSSAGMAAMSGSSVASAATMGSIAVPEMIKHGYKPRVAAGVVTIAGTLAIMIPPSVVLVLYGIITENSIGKLLIAGIIPGVMTALAYCITIVIWQKVAPDSMPSATSKFTWAQRFQSLKPLWAFILLAFSVMGSMYLGWATPTEAAAVGALGALIIPLARKTMTFRDIIPAVVRTIETSTMIFTIIIGAMIFGYFMTMTQAAQKIIAVIGTLHVPGWSVLALFFIVLLFLGCIMDQVAILLLTLPLIYPIISSYGYDPIWFGIIMTKIAEIGLVTPPVGMNAYVVSASTGIPLSEVFRGTGCMLITEAISLMLLIAFPMLSTWLPAMMF